MVKKIINAVQIYRSFWQKVYDKLCHHLGGVGAYLFLGLIMIFLFALILFFSLIQYIFAETKGEITSVAVILSCFSFAPIVDLWFRAAFYMVERMRSFIDRLKGL
jgi:hypothetical protein